MAYDSNAQEFVFGFYAKGWSKERSLPEIRKVYAGFSGSTWDEWERKYEWKRRRAERDRRASEFSELLANQAQTLIAELDLVRLDLLKKLTDTKHDPQIVHAYTSVVKQMDGIAQRHLRSADPLRIPMEVLNRAFGEVFERMREIPELAKPLAKHAETVGEVVTAVSERYGAA